MAGTPAHENAGATSPAIPKQQTPLPDVDGATIVAQPKPRTPFDSRALVAAVRLWEDQQRQRIRTGNLIGAVIRAGSSAPDELHANLERLEQNERDVDRFVIREWRKHPLAPWAQSIRGLGEHSAAILVALLDGDPYMAHPKRWARVDTEPNIAAPSDDSGAATTGAQSKEKAPLDESDGATDRTSPILSAPHDTGVMRQAETIRVAPCDEGAATGEAGPIVTAPRDDSDGAKGRTTTSLHAPIPETEPISRAPLDASDGATECAEPKAAPHDTAAPARMETTPTRATPATLRAEPRTLALSGAPKPQAEPTQLAARVVAEPMHRAPHDAEDIKARSQTGPTPVSPRGNSAPHDVASMDAQPKTASPIPEAEPTIPAATSCTETKDRTPSATLPAEPRDRAPKRTLVADPPYIRTPGQLWQYCGIGSPKERRDETTQADLLRDGKPLAKSRLRLIAESLLKAGNAEYRAVYDAARAHVAERVHAKDCPQCRAKTGDPWRPGHQHAHALRIVAKRFLLALWLEAERVHGVMS